MDKTELLCTTQILVAIMVSSNLQTRSRHALSHYIALLTGRRRKLIGMLSIAVHHALIGD